MALQQIIAAHPNEQLTEELPGGKWCHTPLYFKYRYGEGRTRKPRQAHEDKFIELMRKRLENMSLGDRAQLIAQLRTEED